MVVFVWFWCVLLFVLVVDVGIDGLCYGVGGNVVLVWVGECYLVCICVIGGVVYVMCVVVIGLVVGFGWGGCV